MTTLLPFALPALVVLMALAIFVQVTMTVVAWARSPKR